ncbi:DNA-binding NarL/FixJ family response regulator [Actinoplanes italicus]|uniref:DNA-binding NarL/FixJ family response regulator n=2 Tax=Actinoplanes italicus TaxID=113567 RepID=A0A2T0K799_9ACTN|nr:DNA-binding NarL/FixJ family response regulator [Actinoplanes italicus]
MGYFSAMGATGDDELIGREWERARLTGLVEDLPTGGGSLALRGGPGVGRSALLSWLSGTARTIGVRVLTVTATPSDAEVPYAGLRRLLPRTDVVTDGGAPPARVAMRALELVAELADRSPLLLTVDDAHQLDPPSWTVLTFVARRLTPHPAMIVFALREGAATTDRLSGSGLPGMTVEPFGPAQAALLLDRHAPGLRPGLRDRVLSLAEGNPLGLVELAAGIGTAQPPPGDDLPLTPRLEQAFTADAAGLPATVRTLLQIAALDDRSSVDEVVAAARLLDPRVGPEDLRAAEDARMIRVDEPFALRFRHPLASVAMRHAMGETRRRAMHRALADVLAAQPERQLRHRACAAVDPDEPLAAQLAEAAGEARRRGAMTSAARAYERAAQLSPDRSRRTDRMLRAAADAYDAGDPGTAARLLDALPHRLAASARIRRDHLRAALRDERWSGTERLLDHLGTAIAVRHQGEAGPVLHGLDLRALEFFFAGPGRDAVVAAARGLSGGLTESQALCVLSLSDPVGRCAEVLPQIRRHARDLIGSPGELHLVALAGLGVGAMPETVRLSATTTGRLRGQGARGLLARSLAVQATAAAQAGNVLLAGKRAAEAGRLSAETSQPLWLLTADMAGARAAALHGDAATALSVVARSPNPPALARLVRGTVAAAEDRPESACDELAPLFDPAASSFHPQIRFWALATFAEAAFSCGRTRQLREVLRQLEPARTAGLPVLDVALAYADAVLADTGDTYAEALARPDLPAWPFELGRLQLAHGGWLRRQRQGGDARRQLRAAAQTFTTLGALPWAVRAATELRAAGERVSPDPDFRRLLTPREQQIAELAADGLSNREIAARLLLSPRSVDSHLSRAYRKAGVSSRAELARLILTTG